MGACPSPSLKQAKKKVLLQGHYEDVLIRDAYDEEVLVSPEEGHYEDVLVRDAWVETVEHEAEYRDVWVVDSEAYTVEVV